MPINVQLLNGCTRSGQTSAASPWRLKLNEGSFERRISRNFLDLLFGYRAPRHDLTLKSILNSIGRLFSGGGRPKEPSPFLMDEDLGPDQSIGSDDWNPFPDPVVLEFRDVLDLHSIPPQMISQVVEEYLDEAHRRSVRWVRIIHGKGIGVQRERVRSILSKTSYVVDFRDAPGNAGGWGATIVTLRENDL